MPAQSALITVMVKAAEKAARDLKRDFGEVENLQTSRKGPGDFVSVADHKAEKTIFEELSKARPTFAFLMEEAGVKGDASTAEGVFIIDPIDGTNNFMHAVPHWCISIGCEQKGEMVAGIVYDPIKDEMFWAEKGRGAYLNNRRLRVSNRTDLDSSLVATSSAPYNSGDHDLWLKQIKATAGTVPLRHFGSGALSLAYVAAGRLDGYWENRVLPWDVAAGYLLVTEAGGSVTDIKGNKYNLHDRKDILATNNKLHAQLITLIGK